MKSIKKNIFIFNLIILLISLITGCSQSATSVFDRDPIYAQNLQYTKVGKIIVEDDVKALVNITYLNSVESEKYNNGKQNFIVGTYITDKTDEKYTLTMNGKSYIKIEDIKKSDKIYENIALRNHWATYSIMTFHDTSNITLLYSDTKGNNTTLSFVKE